MRDRYTLLLPVYVPTMILSFATGMLAPILPLYVSSFGISYGVIGIVLASQGIGNFVGDVPAGVLMGRLGQRWTMLAGVGALGLATLAVGFARSVPELILYGLIAGMGNALWNISRHAYMTTGIPPWQRGKATATFGGLNRVGSFAGPYIGGLAAAAYGMRLPFVIFAVVALLALITSGFFIRDAAPPVAVHRGGLRGHGRHLAGVLQEHWRTFATAGVGQLLGQMIRSGRAVLIPLYGADMVGLDVASISLIVTLSALIDMTMFLPVGYVMDRYGRKFANVPCFFIMGVGMAMIPFTSTFGGLLVAAMVIGFGNGLGSGAMLTLGSDLAPKESVGEFLGMWRLIGDSGQTGAPIVVGGVAQLVGLSPATFVIAAMGIAAALVFGLFVPETKNLHPAPVQAKA